ncbi:MAG: dienelactone hydrolase family protein [Pirellulales bacterium]
MIEGLNRFLVLITFVLCCFGLTVSYAQDAASLTKSQADELIAVTWKKRTENIKQSLQEELDKDEILAPGKAMKLLVKQFGQAPQTGAALYISLHGGGNAPARVNDQQWRNQIRLYEPEEGYYVAPRAPTDTWNLWHEAHMDDLLDRLILAFVVCKNVDPNRVYIMGYSAGGDGVFQLAPRMSDRWAAASMMAGHPNETRADGLRNVPFALFMGGDDGAYNRNKLAGQWKEELEKLAKADQGGYQHFVQIYPNTGHWMNGRDREVLPWFTKFTRTTWPKKVVWLQDDITHDRLYWIGVDKSLAKGGSKIVAEVQGQTIAIESELAPIRLYLSDKLLDLDSPVTVTLGGKQVFQGLIKRTQAAIDQSLDVRMDRELAASAVLEVGP